MSSELFSCRICYEENSVVALSKCNHAICCQCMLNIMSFKRPKFCPICRVSFNEIVVDRYPPRKFQEYDLEALLPHQIEPFYAVDSEILEYINSIIAFRCKKCGEEFESKDELVRHILDHGLTLCRVCVENLFVFPKDYVYYTFEEVVLHERDPVKGHAFCNVCNQYFFDTAALTQHKKVCHVLCPICPELYLKDHHHLKIHAKGSHYICDTCANKEKILIFPTESQLLDHRLLFHYEQLTREDFKKVELFQNTSDKSVPKNHKKKDGCSGDLILLSEEAFPPLGSYAHPRSPPTLKKKPNPPIRKTFEEEFPPLSSDRKPKSNANLPSQKHLATWSTNTQISDTVSQNVNNSNSRKETEGSGIIDIDDLSLFPPISGSKERRKPTNQPISSHQKVGSTISNVNKANSTKEITKSGIIDIDDLSLFPPISGSKEKKPYQSRPMVKDQKAEPINSNIHKPAAKKETKFTYLPETSNLSKFRSLSGADADDESLSPYLINYQMIDSTALSVNKSNSKNEIRETDLIDIDDPTLFPSLSGAKQKKKPINQLVANDQKIGSITSNINKFNSKKETKQPNITNTNDQSQFPSLSEAKKNKKPLNQHLSSDQKVGPTITSVNKSNSKKEIKKSGIIDIDDLTLFPPMSNNKEKKSSRSRPGERNKNAEPITSNINKPAPKKETKFTYLPETSNLSKFRSLSGGDADDASLSPYMISYQMINSTASSFNKSNSTKEIRETDIIDIDNPSLFPSLSAAKQKKKPTTHPVASDQKVGSIVSNVNQSNTKKEPKQSGVSDNNDPSQFPSLSGDRERKISISRPSGGDQKVEPITPDVQKSNLKREINQRTKPEISDLSEFPSLLDHKGKNISFNQSITRDQYSLNDSLTNINNNTKKTNKHKNEQENNTQVNEATIIRDNSTIDVNIKSSCSNKKSGEDSRSLNSQNLSMLTNRNISLSISDKTKTKPEKIQIDTTKCNNGYDKQYPPLSANPSPALLSNTVSSDWNNIDLSILSINDKKFNELSGSTNQAGKRLSKPLRLDSKAEFPNLASNQQNLKTANGLENSRWCTEPNVISQLRPGSFEDKNQPSINVKRIPLHRPDIMINEREFSSIKEPNSVNKNALEDNTKNPHNNSKVNTSESRNSQNSPKPDVTTNSSNYLMKLLQESCNNDAKKVERFLSLCGNFYQRRLSALSFVNEANDILGDWNMEKLMPVLIRSLTGELREELLKLYDSSNIVS